MGPETTERVGERVESPRAAAARLPAQATPHHGHSWLPAVVPASARRFRVHDADLARTLEDAGAELVEAGADVEIATAAGDVGLAPFAVVTLGAEPRPERALPVRAATRLAEAGTTAGSQPWP